jgi:hypothetical protein
MEALDDWIATLGAGHPLLLATVIAVLLGLRHAADPDHLAALVPLVAAEDDRRVPRAARLGMIWGAGHGTSLIVFGVPIVLAARSLPESARAACDLAVGALIVAVSVRLLLRWRRGHLRAGPHGAASTPRSPLAAYGIGVVHGMGGSAGLGVLLLASIADTGLALVALVLFASCAALSMSGMSAVFAGVVGHRAGTIQRAAPVLALGGVAFGTSIVLAAATAL